MAQRDEGLDRLESFIAVAAETRIGLQREAEKTADLSDEIEDIGGRIDAEMKDLGTTAREFDARYGEQYEETAVMSWSGSPFGGGGLAFLARLNAREHRRQLIGAADALEYAYEHFPEARQQAAETLDQAAVAASEAYEQFQEAARAMADAAPPLSGSLATSIGGLLQQVHDNLPEN